MRRRVLNDLPSDVRRAIRRLAYRETISFEEAAVDLVRSGGEINHDLDILRQCWDDNGDTPPF